MNNLDSILKSRDITLPTKVRLVKAMVFPVVMYICESWTIKKAECIRIDAFELWCWRRLLRVPWTARRFNQSILKEISPGCSLEGMMLKLKLQYFGHLMRRADSLKRPWCWERLRAGGEGDHRGWDGWMASLTQWAWVWVDSGSWWWTGRPGVLQFMGSQRVRHDWATELSNGSRRKGMQITMLVLMRINAWHCTKSFLLILISTKVPWGKYYCPHFTEGKIKTQRGCSFNRACWVASFVSDSVGPHRRQPTRLPRPWDSPGKNTGVGCHFLLQQSLARTWTQIAELCYMRMHWFVPKPIMNPVDTTSKISSLGLIRMKCFIESKGWLWPWIYV